MRLRLNAQARKRNPYCRVYSRVFVSRNRADFRGGNGRQGYNIRRGAWHAGRRGLTAVVRVLFARCHGEPHRTLHFRSMATTGICYKTWPQAPFDCTRSDSGTWQAGRRWNLSSISVCATRCLQCERCAWVAYGRRECAWSVIMLVLRPAYHHDDNHGQ